MGFGTNWLTEWYSFNPHFKQSFGLDARDNFAGFVYIGTPAATNEERERPELENIVTYWQPGASLKKGDQYGKKGDGLPKAGFSVS